MVNFIITLIINIQVDQIKTNHPFSFFYPFSSIDIFTFFFADDIYSIYSSSFSLLKSSLYSDDTILSISFCFSAYSSISSSIISIGICLCSFFPSLSFFSFLSSYFFLFFVWLYVLFFSLLSTNYDNYWISLRY